MFSLSVYSRFLGDKLKRLLLIILLLGIIGYFYLSLHQQNKLKALCIRDIEMTAGLCAFHSALTDIEKEKCRISWYSDRYGYGEIIDTYDEAIKECIKRKCKPAMGECLGTF